MAFNRIRTINGRRYLYEEIRWRDGGKVLSRSRSLGPIDGGGRTPKRRRAGIFDFISAQRLSPEDRVWAAIARETERIEKYQRELFGETAQERQERERQGFLEKLHKAYGLRLGPTHPAPIEPQSALASASANQAPAIEEPAPEAPADPDSSSSNGGAAPG